MIAETKDIKYLMYVRKSSEGDERQVQSIEDQIDVLSSLAKRQILKVAKIFEERKSAKDPGNRPEFLKMIQMIEDGAANGILCWKYDRLTRNALEDGKLKWLLQQGVIKVILTIDRDYRPEDNALLLSIEGGMANQYIRDLSRNVKRGMESKRQKGQLIDGEYNPKREELLADKAKIKENIDSCDRRIDDWFELTEKAFDFVTFSREAFINGDVEIIEII